VRAGKDQPNYDISRCTLSRLFLLCLVVSERLELSHLSAPPPQDGVSTKFHHETIQFIPIVHEQHTQCPTRHIQPVHLCNVKSCINNVLVIHLALKHSFVQNEAHPVPAGVNLQERDSSTGSIFEHLSRCPANQLPWALLSRIGVLSVVSGLRTG